MHPSDRLSGFEPGTAHPRSSGPGFSGLRLLPNPVRLDCYELLGVIAESPAAVVYLGTDRTLRMPVAIREYMPQGLAWRDATSRVVPLSSAQELPFASGLQTFIDEARTLARCDHPCLLRIVRLLEANGTAFSVMPHYVGRRLTDVRRDAMAPHDEQQLRALLASLLGALEAFHAFGSVHGGVSPDNILLLQNGRPVLLRPRAQGRPTSAERIDTPTGHLHGRNEPVPASVGSASGPWTDLRDAARVIRFLMVGEWAGNHSLAVSGGRSWREGASEPSLTGPQAHYSRSLLEALDSAESPLPERRPRNIAEFQGWLKEASPSEPAVRGARRHDSPAPADDVSLRERQKKTVPAVALASGAPEWPEPEGGLAPETAPDVDPAPTAEPRTAAAGAPQSTPPAAPRAKRDPRAETVDRDIPAQATSQRDPTRRMALTSVVVLGILAVLAMGTWLLNRPPVAIQGWSKALAPPSLIPPRNAVATAAPPLPEAGSQAASRALESRGALTGTSPDNVRSAAPAVGDLAADRAPLTSPTNPAPATTAPENSGVLPHLANTEALPTPVAPEAPPSPPNPPPLSPSPPNPGSPRELCAPRTQFALYRCMQTQCNRPRWSHHDQCIRLRVTDDVN